MVCMGNICRSPTAEGVLRHKLRAAGLDGLVEVDSAGTHAFHVGSPPDKRSVAAARERGYDLQGLRARQVAARDFESFDLILAMDWDNLALLQAQCPPERQRRLKLLTEFAERFDSAVVPDPYDGPPQAFAHVLDVVEDACDGLVAHLSKTNNRQNSGTS